jgi:hypothetical protein
MDPVSGVGISWALLLSIASPRRCDATTRTFTAAEQASNHCQVGNIGAAVAVIQGWSELSTISRMAEKADAAEEFARH